MLLFSDIFRSPVFHAVGVLCTWMVLFFPFAWWAQAITRSDALSRIEAYILGQTGGPLGVYAVMRANRKAAEKQYKDELLAETMKTHEVQAGLPPEEVQKQNKELGRPGLLESPGGRAWRAPPKEGLTPAKDQRSLDTVGLNTPVRSQEEPVEKTPFEPPEEPPIKAAGAFRPPPVDYRFTHADEQPEGVDDPQDGDAKDR